MTEFHQLHKRKKLEPRFGLVAGMYIAMGLLAFGFISRNEQIRQENIQAVATAQYLHSETIPQQPINCFGTAVDIALFNWSSKNNETLGFGGTASLVRRAQLKTSYGEEYEKYLFISANHINESVVDPNDGLDNSIDKIKINTSQGPNQFAVPGIYLEPGEITQIMDDNGNLTDISVLVATSIEGVMLPNSVNSLGENINGWIDNPDRVTVAAYPSGIGGAMVITELDTETLDQKWTIFDGSFITVYPKEGFSTLTYGASGSVACAETVIFSNGVADGIVTNIPRYNSTQFDITPFPKNIQEQIENAWNSP